ncbi:hypothetical protein RSOLAG22IIIB_00752 [Rhizoctonia solani]|uniref:Uncharacterized protein n=1 Tax=Rhizoctonia solani TaxID=456999 RepID=A0A0K6FW24_9AGAM|nr:hypothetical protein RSOLAG22IIIB_00752 [Rhizoctonia solani]
MFAPAHRHIPGQPAYTGHKRKANTATGSSVSSSPYHDSRHPAQQAYHFTRSSHRGSPVPDHSSATDSTQSSPRTGAYSPAPSSSGSSSSAKSVRWGESDSDEEARISPGCYSVGSPKPHPKPVLKYRTLHVANAPSLFDENTPKIAASAAIDTILYNLAICVKNFKPPSELDFSPNAASIMVLAKVEKNKSFIDQLCRFERLAKSLAEIPTHGDAQLTGKYDAASAAISRALSRMKEYQTKLGIKFICTALDELAIEIHICVEGFVYPRQLDFAEDCEDGMLLVRSERNKPFVYQLQRFSLFLGRLKNIPEYDNEKLEHKRRDVGDQIERNIERMKSHQLSLYRCQLAESQQPRGI